MSIHFLTLLLCLSTTVLAQTKYVKQDATGNGSSWTDAAGDLSAVLNEASYGDEIWVAAGIYTPVTCTECSTLERSTSFVIKDGVRLIGGFSGNETNLAERNLAEQNTILSGDIDADSLPANNSFNVIFTENVSTETLIDGVTIRDGFADNLTTEQGSRDNSGAGWYNSGVGIGGNSNPTIARCRFVNNYAIKQGGGFFSDASWDGHTAPTFSECTFDANSANSGGAIYIDAALGYAAPIISSCDFVNNTADVNIEAKGGAIYLNSSDSGTVSGQLLNCNFSYNLAAEYGGAIYIFGKDGTCDIAVKNCNFIENIAQEGGAVFGDASFGGSYSSVFEHDQFTKNGSQLDGGAFYSNGSFGGHANPTLLSCTFLENYSTLAGAAMFNNGIEGECNPTVINCLFERNIATTYGGAAYSHGKTGNSSPNFINCIFSHNSAYSAGALYNLGSIGGHANANILNCLFFSNHANVGGAIYANANNVDGESNPTVTNCIFWDNQAPLGKVFRCVYGQPTVSYCLFDTTDCEALYSGVNGQINCGEGLMFNLWPGFADTANFNFNLLVGTNTVNKGNNVPVFAANLTTDYNHATRIAFDTVDLGPIEYQFVPTPATITTQPNPTQTICQGESTSLTVAADGTQPISYQWFTADGTALENETNPVLILENINPSASNSYYCQVSNIADTLNTDIAELIVNPTLNPTIQISASDTLITSGQNIEFTAQITNGGTTPLYQWLVNLQPIEGANQPAFSTAILLDSSLISCQIISNETCSDNTQSTSQQVLIQLITSVFSIPYQPISVWPNPANSNLHINLTTPVGSLELYNNALQKVGSWTRPIPNNIDLTQYPTGNYYLRYITAEKSQILPIAIVK